MVVYGEIFLAGSGWGGFFVFLEYLVRLKHSPSFAVAKKFKFFNGDEFIEGTGKF